jgi:hypothetical protein
MPGPSRPAGGLHILMRVTNVSGDQDEGEPAPVDGVPAEPATRQYELAIERIKTARSRWRCMRDCSAATIVGGAAVALTLMLGGLPVWQDEFIST